MIASIGHASGGGDDPRDIVNHLEGDSANAVGNGSNIFNGWEEIDQTHTVHKATGYRKTCGTKEKHIVAGI